MKTFDSKYFKLSLYKFINNYAKECGLKSTDKNIAKDVKDVAIDIKGSSNNSSFGVDFCSDTPEYIKLKDFQEHLVQETIDFINSNEDIKKLLNDKRSDIEKSLENKDMFYTDFGFYFGIDGLESSLNQNTWTPASDSYVSLTVGNSSVLDVQ